MEYEERRKIDEHKELVGRMFLEKHLFHLFPTYELNTDKSKQVRGVDFTFVGKDNFQYICDLKVAASKINKPQPLKTGCLECFGRYKAKNNGMWLDYVGWFLNESEVANTIIYLWIDETKSGNLLSVDDIVKAEVSIIKTDDIWKHLGDNGWDKENLSNKILTEYKGNESAIFTTKYINGVGFNSPARLYYAERPINILLTRETYKKIAVFNKTWDFKENQHLEKL